MGRALGLCGAPHPLLQAFARIEKSTPLFLPLEARPSSGPFSTPTRQRRGAGQDSRLFRWLLQVAILLVQSFHLLFQFLKALLKTAFRSWRRCS
jgi:hypothetical protein